MEDVPAERGRVPSYREVDMMSSNEPICECIFEKRSKSDSSIVLDTSLTVHAAIPLGLFLFAVSVVY